MAAPLECPGTERWQALLHGDLPPEERDRCERHLESCPRCQEHLEHPGEFAETLRALARRVGDPTLTPPDPAWGAFLERLQGVRSTAQARPGEPADLYFLRPSDRPGVLGTLGEYEVLEVIGQGGMGVVLKAFEPALNRFVAVKVLAAAVAGSATARARFTREARAAAAVCHDHVVPVYAVHEADGLPYLVMQYVAGESLQERLDRDGPLPAEEAVRIGHQAAAGLAAAHAQGLIHRDIKPANLLLENGVARVRITDFGLARMADAAGLTRDGVVSGTPEYMAPEQARGEPVDPRADLYSLGAVLYACCTGVPPFQGSSAVAVLRRVSDEPPTPPRSLNPGVPVWLEALIRLLLAKAPEDRPPSAAAVADLLEGYLAHLRQPKAVPAPPLPSPRGGRWTGKGPWSRPLTWLTAGLLAALAVAVLALAWAFWPAGGAGGAPPANQAFREYFHSFKGDVDITQDFAWDGQEPQACLQFEPEGLRIVLPEGHPGKRMGTGLSTTFGVQGDFEITMSFEVLKEPEPADAGEGTGGYLWVDLDTPALNRTFLSRSVHERKLFGIWFRLSDPGTGQRRAEGVKHFPTGAMKGRLRLVRNGAVVSHYVAEESSDAFTLLFQHPLGTEDVKAVRIGGLTGGPKASLDFRVTDLRIRAPSFTDLPDTALIGLPSAAGNGWLFAGLAVGAGFAGSLTLAVWLAARQRRRGRGRPAPAAAEGGPAPPEEAPAPVTFPCSSCGKKLRAGAGLAGKKVRCPQCRELVLVPAPGAGQT